MESGNFLAENVDVFEYLLEFSTDFSDVLNGGNFRKEWPKRRKVENIPRKFLAENFDVFEYLLEFSTDFGEILNGGKFRKEWPKRRKVENIPGEFFLVENFDRRFEYLLEFSTDFDDVLNGGNFHIEWLKRWKWFLPTRETFSALCGDTLNDGTLKIGNFH